MSFRLSKSPNRGRWDRTNSMVYRNSEDIDEFKNNNPYTKKPSQKSYAGIKEVAGDAYRNLGKILNGTKSSRNRVFYDDNLGISRTSYFGEQSIVYTQRNNQIGNLYDELNSKDEQLQMLKSQNQSLKFLLESEIKRIDQQDYEIYIQKQQEIDYLTNRIASLKQKGCLSNSRSDFNEYQLQLQDHINQIKGKLQQSEQYRNQLSSIITKLYRQNVLTSVAVQPRKSFRRSSVQSSKPLRTKVLQCMEMLDGLVR